MHNNISTSRFVSCKNITVYHVRELAQVKSGVTVSRYKQTMQVINRPCRMREQTLPTVNGPSPSNQIVRSKREACMRSESSTPLQAVNRRSPILSLSIYLSLSDVLEPSMATPHCRSLSAVPGPLWHLQWGLQSASSFPSIPPAQFSCCPLSCMPTTLDTLAIVASLGRWWFWPLLTFSGVVARCRCYF
jgi:hypothetical protein